MRCGPVDVVEDHKGAERAVAFVGIEKRVNHRQSIAEDVGERDSQHLPGRRVH